MFDMIFFPAIMIKSIKPPYLSHEKNLRLRQAFALQLRPPPQRLLGPAQQHGTHQTTGEKNRISSIFEGKKSRNIGDLT